MVGDNVKTMKEYNVPNPILDYKEEKLLMELATRYEKMMEPSTVAKIGSEVGTKISNMTPERIKKLGVKTKETLSTAEIYKQAVEIASNGFQIIEKQVSKYTLSEETIMKEINALSNGYYIKNIEEICLFRGYDISKIVNKYKDINRLLALAEGGSTGAAGFAGIPFNLVFSLFLYYRAVQQIAMFYGYDVKHDAGEMMIATEVYMNSLSPQSNSVNNELNGAISKIMVMTEATVVKQTNKSWYAMASKNGVTRLLTQMRALSNKYAQRALEQAGEKGLENSLFKDVLEQIGRKLTLETTGKMVPFVSGIFGALIDVSQMNRVVEYADIFYNKRFIWEKEERIKILSKNQCIK